MARQTTNKIIIIGYRATGKSCVGKQLAASLAFTFVDMDKVIEKRQGQTILAMVEAYGWDYFRNKEKELLQEYISSSDTVLSTGGGAVLHQDVWPDLMENGFVVWLTASTDTICHRLAGDKKTGQQRPALTDTDTLSEVTKVLHERQPLYLKSCHMQVATDQNSISEIAEKIKHEFLNR